MACKREDRVRHNTIAFWLSDEEKGRVEARILVSGLQKGEYYHKAILGQEVQVTAGAYMSARLARALEDMRTFFGNPTTEQIAYLKELLETIIQMQEREKLPSSQEPPLH